MTEAERRCVAEQWAHMTIDRFRSHAGWVWYDYTHPGRQAQPSREYALAVRVELSRRENDQ